MCHFCEGKQIEINCRNGFADNNFCPEDEFGNTDCSQCKNCYSSSFEIKCNPPSQFHTDAFFYINFFNKFPRKDSPEELLFMGLSSEGIQIKYCPFCGRKF